eukprot:CAMPEP_0194281912 /NCGR_PEP_ID=MMETSP0169-20130528/21885_1 /TAXON_ID=218684 /ORGANISM="Corethron pennatum, Strain L29A3" /LENGTH=152 /DNA_ID=CAMNT_0039027097 /DNA_START=90 /DNA_END=548 /DNA_ORIENTATION=-
MTSFVFHHGGVHGGLYPAAIASAPSAVCTPSACSASRSSPSRSAMDAARIVPPKVTTATVRAGTSAIDTCGEVGAGTSAARANRLAGRKNAILKAAPPSPPGGAAGARLISTGAVIAMGAAPSFSGAAMTPMNFASRMNEPPWSPSIMPLDA